MHRRFEQFSRLSFNKLSSFFDELTLAKMDHDGNGRDWIKNSLQTAGKKSLDKTYQFLINILK